MNKSLKYVYHAKITNMKDILNYFLYIIDRKYAMLINLLSYQATFQVRKYMNDSMSETLFPRYFSASALSFWVIGASKIEIVLRNGIIITVSGFQLLLQYFLRFD